MPRSDEDEVVNQAGPGGDEPKVRVAVLGCGNVGGALVALLLADADRA